MTFAYRARAYWACVSILFNQTVHFGGAPYPYTFSETCYIRRNRWQYRLGQVVVDSIFRLFGERDHCEMSYLVGKAFRAKEQM